MPTSPDPARPAAAGAPEARPAILVVDDDGYVHDTIETTLRRLDLTVIRARSAAEGHELARRHRPRLAIVDVGLPDVDGFQLTRRLRADADLAGLRIVILTGYVPDPSEAAAAGADAILGKPFRVGEFLAQIEAQLGAPGGGTR